MGNNGYTFRALENLFWNAFIRRRHDLVQNSARMIQTVDRCFAIRLSPGGASHTETEYCHQCHKLPHVFHLSYPCASLRLSACEAHKVSLTLGPFALNVLSNPAQ